MSGYDYSQEVANEMLEQLEAENASLKEQLAEARGQIDDCRAQIRRQAGMLAAAQKDAERYRWLRLRPWQTCHTLFPHAPWIHEGFEANQKRMDAAIDAAMKEGK